MKSILAAAGLAGLTTAAPSASLHARDTFCGQWDLEVAGPYTVYNNLWGMDSAESGEQCTTNNGLADDGSLSWSVDWTWVGGQGQVKSYPNVVFEADAAPRPLSEVSAITAEWDWS
jgi:xyloglucan-specific endo-beta-1,4-glucanase